MDHSSTKEPLVAYHKLNNDTLEMFGTAFGDEVTSENILFLQKITSYFRIHSVVFKWFHFDEKMLRIFDVFNEKLQQSVKNVTFKRCLFPEALVYKGSLELNRVTECSFIQCVASEESLTEMFKVFKNAPVTSLTISKIFDCDYAAIDSNVKLKKFDYRKAIKVTLRINDLKLDSFFPNINFLSLSSSSLYFGYFSLTTLKNLNFVDLNDVNFVSLSIEKIFERLPINLKRFKVSKLYTRYDLNFIDSALKQEIIIDTPHPFTYDNIYRVNALSLLSSLDFRMYHTNDKMAEIKKYVERNGGAINTVTSVAFDMTFNYPSIRNMLTLLTYFPNLDDITIEFRSSCDESLNDDQIRLLFSAFPVINVKKLLMHFCEIEGSTPFYRFIVELMKLCQKMTTLKFRYEIRHSFAINIKEIVKEEDIQFTNLDTFLVSYLSDYIDISVDLFYVAKYKIKNLTININGSVQNLDALDQFDCFSVDILSFYLHNNSTSGNLMNKIFTKFPHVTNLHWVYYPSFLTFANVLQIMKGLKNVTVYHTFEVEDFANFLTILPLDLESLEIECPSNKMEEIEKVFYEKFPTAALTMEIGEM